MNATASPTAKKKIAKPAAEKPAPKAASEAKPGKSNVTTKVATSVTDLVKEVVTKSKTNGGVKAKAKPAVVSAAKASEPKPAKVAKVAKEKKVSAKKPKLVRDSFTFPEADYARIGDLKRRALKSGHEVKKSELLRAGLFVLSDLNDGALINVLAGIDKLKPGRPSK